MRNIRDTRLEAPSARKSARASAHTTASYEKKKKKRRSITMIRAYAKLSLRRRGPFSFVSFVVFHCLACERRTENSGDSDTVRQRRQTSLHTLGGTRDFNLVKRNAEFVSDRIVGSISERISETRERNKATRRSIHLDSKLETWRR